MHTRQSIAHPALALLLVILAQGLATPAAHAEWIEVLPGSTTHLAATNDHVVVVQHGEALALHEDGTVIGRLSGRRRDTPGGTHRSADKEAAEILDSLGVSELDRESEEATELVDDERTLGRRRDLRGPSGAAGTPTAGVRALATGPDGIWASSEEGIFRLRTDAAGESRWIREFGQNTSGYRLAAGRSRLLVAKENALLLLSRKAGESDTRLATHADLVAMSASGNRYAWATSANLLLAQPGETPRQLDVAARVSDLAFCGETLVILNAESLVSISPDGDIETLPLPGPLRSLTCGAQVDSPWLAIGTGLFVSADQGRHWQAFAPPAGAPPTAVAATAHHVWLATRNGLFMSSSRASSVDPAQAWPQEKHHRRPRRSGAPAWFSWLPRVSMKAAADFSPGSRAIEALAYATFPLDPRALPITAAAELEHVEPQSPGPTVPATLAASGLPRDPDQGCLALARRKAISLAMAEPERAQSYVGRAGRAAWLPELRVLVAQRYGRTESLDVTSSSTALTSPVGIDTANDVRYEARATWDLGRLVFSPDELAAQSQALHMAELRREIETTMNRLYFERRQLLVEHALAHEESLRRKLRAGEIEAELDAMSDGQFAACLAGREVSDR